MYYSRTAPFHARIKERYLLTKPTSSKKTYHVVLDTLGSQLSFKVGDSIGILPENDPKEVASILKALSADGTETIFDSRAKADVSIREFLQRRANLARVNSAFLKLLIEKGADRNFFEPLLLSENKAKLGDFLHSHTLLELLSHAPVTPAEVARVAMPLLPRFYSIANSTKVFPDEIHLVVAYVQYSARGQIRRGVGSHFVCNLATIDATPIPIYVQPSNGFTLPDDPNASLIMVGPGTGIAPYRAFLQERIATQAEGKNWLYFGERNRASDFYYESFWTDLEAQGRLRLDLAFSRDTAEKVYVQHKMYEHRKSLWEWLQEGAYFYVCGDAEEMAKDVDDTLQRIAKEEGRLSEEDARLYVKKLRAEKRYLADVY